MKYFTTSRGGTGWTGWGWPTSTGTADISKWTCPPTLALPVSKIYPDACSQTADRRTMGYTYLPNGSLPARTRQRMPAVAHGFPSH